ncbi:type I restriction enzyme, S subunit [Cetobacterium ceti]|uniref:Type I restriction enzyme, S subunit n=1 Tax=Cetobacterium ceti TaxID=180163 RepID=A0A1T4QPA7_9FUSO|nr:restriction endonuclease subunit S [Cetobacterium ceti]SKA05301.1 type I restriction enzyme, S subunit [Cetobacterium ceti]
MVKFILDNFDTIFRDEKSFETFDKMILDLAVRGKLVPQIEDEEPASKLLQKIKEEKESLISEKVIKKEKPLPPITEDEKPFDIPDSWEWVRLGDIAFKVTDGSHNPPKDSSVGFPMFSAKNIIKGELDYYNPDRYVTLEDFEKENMRTKIKEDDILLSIVGSIGKTCIVKNYQTNFILQRSISVLDIPINKKYIIILLNSNFLLKQMFSKAKGTAQLGIYLNVVKNLVLILPSLKEQERIVEKVEKLQKLSKRFKEIYNSNEKTRANLKKSILDEVEKSDTNNELLISLEKLFGNFEKVIKTKEDVKDIRNLVLSLAVRGKLVPQIENEEPASKLLQRIKEEKEKLIAEKVIKKEKPLPPITEDEKPFNIPSSWEWVRLGEIGETQTGTTPPKSKIEYFNGDICFIKPGDISNLGINYNNEKISKKAISDNKGRMIKKNSLLMVCIGGSIGKSFYTNRDVSCNQQINSITGYQNIDSKYFYYFSKANYFQKNILEESVGSATPIINKNNWQNLYIPLPPLKEQERIVKRVDELMAICDTLESKIEIGEKINQKILTSLLK